MKIDTLKKGDRIYHKDSMFAGMILIVEKYRLDGTIQAKLDIPFYSEDQPLRTFASLRRFYFERDQVTICDW